MANDLKIIERIISSLSPMVFKALLYKNVEKAFNVIFQATSKKYGFGVIKPDPQIMQDLENRIFILSEKTTDRLKGDLRYELLEGMQAGESVDMISERIKTVFDGNDVNTERIARNEILLSSKNGQYAAFTAANVWGTEWQTTNDDRTCPICRRMNGQVRKLDEPFIDPKTGDKYPIAHSHIQCRCTEIPIMEKPE